MKLAKFLLILFWLGLGVPILFCTPKTDIKYDGVWFLGFNLERPLMVGSFGQKFRQAIAYSINRHQLNKQLFNTSPGLYPFVPYGSTDWQNVARFRHAYEYSPTRSAEIMAEIINTDSLRKNITQMTLLHTDGLQTVETVVFLKKALKEIGIELKTKSVAMFPLVDWENELIRGEYDFFLMGFKAENYPQENSLICPLLESSSSVNFFKYRNSALDEACRLSQKLDIDLISQVMDDLPFFPLFYIEVFNNE